eukprot:6460214-Amphidinium_carterae.1
MLAFLRTQAEKHKTFLIAERDRKEELREKGKTVGRRRGTVREEHNSQTVGKLDALKRRQVLQTLIEGDVEFGPNFEQAVTLAALKSCQTCEECMYILYPYRSHTQWQIEASAPWNALDPKLSCCSFDAVSKARLLLRSVYHELLIPAIAKGNEGVRTVADIAGAMMNVMLRPAREGRVPIDSDAVIDSAMAELQELVIFIRALQGQGNGGIAAIDSIMSAREGAKLLLKQTIRQTKHWRQVEQALRSCHVAVETMMPQIFDALASLGDGTVQWPAIVAKYATWLDALPASNTTRLESAVQEALQKGVADKQDLGELATLASVCHDLWASMPEQMRGRPFFSELEKTARTKAAQLEEKALRASVRSALLNFCSKDRICNEP